MCSAHSALTLLNTANSISKKKESEVINTIVERGGRGSQIAKLIKIINFGRKGLERKMLIRKARPRQFCGAALLWYYLAFAGAVVANCLILGPFYFFLGRLITGRPF